MDLKDKLRQARKKAQLSQQELSAVIGVTDKAISAYEVGRSSPPLKILKKISEATHTHLNFFLDTTDQITLEEIYEKLDSIDRQLQALRSSLQVKK